MGEEMDVLWGTATSAHPGHPLGVKALGSLLLLCLFLSNIQNGGKERGRFCSVLGQ